MRGPFCHICEVRICNMPISKRKKVRNIRRTPQTKCALGIIDPTDYSNGKALGGASGFVRSILPYLKQQVTVFGIGLNGNVAWQSHYLEPNASFIPICNLQSPSKIPMRLKVLINYFRHRKRILNSGVDVLYIQMPECCLPFLYNNNDIPILCS